MWCCVCQIFDRLLASIGQDTLDALFWSTAVREKREGGEGGEGGEGKRRDYSGAIFYFIVATGYVCILLILLWYMDLESFHL